MMTAPPDRDVIQHPGELQSNDWRRRCASLQPRSVRTYTPSLAVVHRAKGWHVFTPEGRPLLDFTSGVLVANLGHNPTSWWEHVLELLGLQTADASDPFAMAAPLTAYNTVTPLEVLASERLLENMRSAPGGSNMECVIWAASGSEAIQKALWCAMRSRPNRDMVLATRFGFHGKKGLAGAVTGSEQDRERDDRVRFLTFPCEESIDLTSARRPLDLAPYEEEFDRIWKTYGDRIGTVITEPYLGGSGSYHPHPKYLQWLESVCRKHDLVFILDEIQSCFGRTGPMYAYTKYGITPDIVCLGKGLGNGVPVACAAGRRDVLDRLDYGDCSDTYSANPLAMAAVLATLDCFESEEVLAKGEKLAAVLEAGLLRLADTGLVAHVRGEGCVWGVECAEHGGRSAEAVARACVQACYEGDADRRAVHLLGPLAGKVLRVAPPLVTPVEDAEEGLEVMRERFQAVAREVE